MFGNFLMKQMLSRQLAGVPDDQKQKIIDAFEKNPQLFKEIAEAVQKRIAGGEEQMSATMAILMERKSELETLLAP